jgi:hypothetical protein
VGKSKGVPIAVAQLVVARDGWACVSCGLDISGIERGWDWSIQHRIPRGMGGSRDPRLNLPSNLVVLCGSGTTGCHGGAESYREGARARGLLLHRIEDPTKVPVEVCTQRPTAAAPFETWPFLLDNDGGRTVVDDDVR